MNFISADWDVPDHVHAVTSTRTGGVSMAPYDSLNLGDHVGDDIAAVVTNRKRLRQELHLNNEPSWLMQVHGTVVTPALKYTTEKIVEADGTYTDQPDRVCVVMTADCLPVALYNHDKNSIAVVHAGWKGLAAGIIAKGVNALGAGTISAWLGPAIGPDCFEVGPEVRDAFLSNLPEHELAFRSSQADKWLADLYILAKQQLATLGVHQVSGGNHCTYTEQELFYSFRREQTTGRMATLVWLD